MQVAHAGPAVALLYVLPLALLVAAAAIAPLIHWRSGKRRPVTSVGGAVAEFAALLVLALALGPQPLFRAALLWSLAGGALVAPALLARRVQHRELSIRPY